MELHIETTCGRTHPINNKIFLLTILLILMTALDSAALDLLSANIDLPVSGSINHSKINWPTPSILPKKTPPHQTPAQSSAKQTIKNNGPNLIQSLTHFYGKHQYSLLPSFIVITVCLITIIIMVRININLKGEIAKRAVMESKLRASELRLQTILDRSITGIVIIDSTSHTIIDVNHSALEIIGAGKDQVVGRLCHPFICRIEPGDCPITDSNKVLDKAEGVLIRSDGSQCAVLKTVIPIFNNGQDCLLCSFIDISKQKESQKALEKALANANEANQIKSQFLATMSHELRTPMNGIIGLTSILLDTPLNSDQLDFARIIKKSALGLLRLITDILELSIIEEGKLKLEIADFNFSAVIEEIIQPTLNQASKKGLSFNYRIGKKIPTHLRGDASRLKQILENLLNNAVKFTYHGEIFMHINLHACDSTHCTLRFSVKDTGIGIESECAQRIFAPFTQADSSFTRPFGGAGLGLTIAKYLTSLMDGEIGLESTPAKGSNFWFTVKFEIPQTSNGLPIKAHYQQRILIVEDNIINQKILLKILSAYGYALQVANNGREAVSELQKRHYDIVLMDLQMPEMNGFEATTAIRNPKNKCLDPQVSIIAVTANNSEKDRQKSLEAGMNDFLPKPITPKRLIEKIELWQKEPLSKAGISHTN